MTDFIYSILQQINTCIETDNFVDVEQSKIELKDLSSGSDWKSLKESICAFLNTNGGFVICGVRERNRKYHFTGFSRDNEPNLVMLQTKTFQDDNGIFPDFTDFIQFDYLPFRQNEVAIISVQPLRDDLKYCKFNNVYYERILTGDHEISISRLNRQKEYKTDIEQAKELTIIPEAGIKDLDLDKINYFVNLLNQSSKKETLKASIAKAKQFLEHRHFIKEEKITTLGMLVCGNDPFRFLENRAEVDCYYDSSNSIAKDKKIFQNDVLSLMDDSFRFVWGHIRTGISIEEGGRAAPEYPEELVREMINNSLAHRDYTINTFVTITVEPGEYLQIKNPGAFKERVKITKTHNDINVRRLIPGIPESKNPKLASVLKVFDKIESQGRGMATLVNAALDNLIDVPFYELRDDLSISLTIPSGKLLDDETLSWIGSFEKYLIDKLRDIPKTEHKMILAYFRKSELLNNQRFYTILLTESNNHFAVIEQLKKADLIFEHSSGTENTPVYVLNRDLMKLDFKDELIGLLGHGYVNYDSVSKQIMNILYRHTHFNKQPVKPFVIIPEVYSQVHGKIINPAKYDTLGKRVRKICRELNSRDILLKDEHRAYSINLNYKNDTSSLNM